MKKIYLSILSVSAICVLNSCYYDNFKELRPEGALPNSTGTCDTMGVVSYSIQIKPIIDASCNQNCHNGSGTGSRDLTSYAGISSGATNGNNPGDGGSLYSSVSWDGVNTSEQMPQGGSKISDCDIAKIKKWAAQGALEN